MSYDLVALPILYLVFWYSCRPFGIHACTFVIYKWYEGVWSPVICILQIKYAEVLTSKSTLKCRAWTSGFPYLLDTSHGGHHPRHVPELVPNLDPPSWLDLKHEHNPAPETFSVYSWQGWKAVDVGTQGLEMGGKKRTPCLLDPLNLVFLEQCLQSHCWL